MTEESQSVLHEVRTLLDQLERSGPPFKPTNFWRPAVEALQRDLQSRGIEHFKSWPSSRSFFYPCYGQGFSYAMFDALWPAIKARNARATEGWVKGRLIGSQDANHDFDTALAYFDGTKAELNLSAHGESDIGSPPQRYALHGPGGPTYGKPYLNYLKILAALSTVAEGPLRTFLEVGGGFGVLGEILSHHYPNSVYIDVDIPPLVSIASWYLRKVAPDAATTGPLDEPGFVLKSDEAWRRGFVACLPSWKLPEIPSGKVDVFVNSFSFQEIEPEAVEAYCDIIATIAPRYVVSLNSRAGKPLAKPGRPVGMVKQTTSAFIQSQFAARGYVLVRRFGRPAAPPQAELAVLRRAAK